MTTNRSSDILFQLIHSLEKAEKRHFKLYIQRSSSNENLKVVQLFDAIAKQKDYDEKLILKKLPGVQKPQLSNLKAHLYKQILASLRLLKSSDSIDLQLNEQFDYAHILYKKGLHLQGLRVLERAKETARANQKFTFLAQAIALEKRIRTLHITGSLQDEAETLSVEALEVSSHIDMVARLSNLALQLYSWYIRHGYARNEKDETEVQRFVKNHLPANAWKQSGFYERLYLYQSYSWSAFICQNFLMYYRYAQKWIDLFTEQPLMQRIETGHYIKGLHHLLNALYDLRHYSRFVHTLKRLEAFAQTERVQETDNFRIQSFFYIAQAKINQHFITGTFDKGLLLVPHIEEKLQEYSLFVDRHRIMVLNYKIASLYFGSGDYATCIDYLQRIIHSPGDLRYDLQCYAQLQHLLAHYELGNHELMEYLSKAVYRFMAKKGNLTSLEEEILKFLKRSFYMSKDKVRTELETFLQRTRQLEKNRFQTRVFVYLDVISWAESKVYGKPFQQIVQQKFEKEYRRKQKPVQG